MYVYEKLIISILIIYDILDLYLRCIHGGESNEYPTYAGKLKDSHKSSSSVVAEGVDKQSQELQQQHMLWHTSSQWQRYNTNKIL
jgi:hypothetical protein